MKKLTLKQENFCLAYIETGNASEAYRRAYDVSKMKPASINRMAKDVIDNINISSRIAELRKPILDKHNITQERVIAELSKIAFFDIRKLVDADGNPVPINLLDDDSAAAINGLKVRREKTSIEVKDDGAEKTDETTASDVMEYKISDKNTALTLAMRHLGILNDKVVLQINDGLANKVERSKSKLHVADQ